MSGSTRFRSLGALLLGAALLVTSDQSVRGQVSQTGTKRDTISIGVDLSLGMPEDAAIRQIAEAGYTVENTQLPSKERTSSLWTITVKGDGRNQPLGAVEFSKGKLKSATRWLGTGDEVEFGRQIYFLMRDFRAQGDSLCAIETTASDEAALSLKTAYFRCGHKSIRIALEALRGEQEVVGLSEELQ